jgi:hypothetical protein
MIGTARIAHVSRHVRARCNERRTSQPTAKSARNATRGHTFAHGKGAKMADATGPPRDRAPSYGPRDQSPV